MTELLWRAPADRGARPADRLMATSENPKLCVTLLRQNAHLPYVNSAFASVASLDFRVFGGCLIWSSIFNGADACLGFAVELMG
jgi:hypothetical protein